MIQLAPTDTGSHRHSVASYIGHVRAHAGSVHAAEDSCRDGNRKHVGSRQNAPPSDFAGGRRGRLRRGGKYSHNSPDLASVSNRSLPDISPAMGEAVIRFSR